MDEQQEMRRDAERYRWLRENIGQFIDDGDGVVGVAYCWQIPLHGIDPSAKERSDAELVDEIADRAVARAKHESA